MMVRVIQTAVEVRKCSRELKRGSVSTCEDSCKAVSLEKYMVIYERVLMKVFLVQVT